jgi:hypothetical protein
MQDSNLILKFLIKEFQNDSIAIYLFCCGNVRSQSTAIDKVMKITKEIFMPFIEEQYIKSVVKTFLEYQKTQYELGNISVKPIY